MLAWSVQIKDTYNKQKKRMHVCFLLNVEEDNFHLVDDCLPHPRGFQNKQEHLFQVLAKPAQYSWP